MGRIRLVKEEDKMTDFFEEMRAEFAQQNQRYEALEESYNELISRANSAFWKPLDFTQDEGVDLNVLKDLAQRLREQTTTGSLHTRAVQLTHAYVFGRGMLVNTDDLQPRIKKAVEHPYNQTAMFSQRAREELTRAMYTDGQVFVLRDTQTRVLTRVPLSQITGIFADNDSPERVWHIKRTWSNGSKQFEKWYATSDYYEATPPAKRLKTIEKVPVDQTKVMHFKSVGKHVGWALGLPVGLPAMQWVETYTQYVQNNARLVESYSKIAFKFSQKASQANASAVTIGGTPANSVGGVASMGLADSLTAMPAIGSQVSFQNGRPIAALAASAVGVSVVALLSDPGAAGSSYGAAQTLDLPTVRVMGVWQDAWVEFYREILLGMGADPEKLKVSFPSIETDVPYRQVTALSQAFQMGGLHREEYRASLLEIMDVQGQKPVSVLPVPDQFNAAHPIPLGSEEDAADDEEEDNLNDPLARQGNSGAVGSVEPDTNFNRQADAGRV